MTTSPSGPAPAKGKEDPTGIIAEPAAAAAGSALLGFVQFVFGGLASPLVGLSGATSGVAFGIVIVVLGAVANALAVFGLRDRGERERVKAERAAARSRCLGRDQL